MKPRHSTFTDLTPLGLLSIQGPDALKFLQGQLTCDVTEVTPLNTRLAAHCNPQGRIITLGRLIGFKDGYLFQMPKNHLPVAIKALKKYAVFFKVSLEDASENYQQIGYQGNLGAHEPDQAVSIHSLLAIKVSKHSRFILLGSFADLSLFREENPASVISYEQWKQFDIQEHIPSIYPETSEKFLPHDLNLPQLKAVSFQKGCYTGQEIIARMEYRGKPKNHLFCAQLQSVNPPIRGSDIFCENKAIGNLIDYIQLEYNTYELLATGQILDKEKTLTINGEQIILNI